MDYRQAQGNPARHMTGITFVIVIHVIAVYALVTGLAHKMVEVVKKPFETKLIEEIAKKPPPDTPPPPPKLAPPPPAFVPPPEVNIAVSAPSPNAITQVTAKVAAPVSAPKPTVHVPPVIDAKNSCAQPQYPPASRRNEESGTVLLRFLIGVDGRVIESQVQTSSGYGRLDNAALSALSRCVFKPGTVNGKPEQSWASLKYKWELE